MAQLQSTGVTGSLGVTGTITAQTLVVQTVTSSISVMTGSTEFGSLSTNTHRFTGSVNISGSLNEVGLVTIRGTTASDTATSGSELLSSTGWVSGSEWTGDFTTGFTHVVGNTVALTNSLAAVGLAVYQIIVTVTGRTAGSFSVTFGGSTPAGGSTVTSTSTLNTTTVSVGTLSITPTTDFNGTVAISIRLINDSSYLLRLQNSDASRTLEIRASNSSANTLIGSGAGAKNTTGISNVAIGSNALRFNINGSRNIAIGPNALFTNPSVNQSVAIGEGAGYNHIGNFQGAVMGVAIGWSAAGSLTTGTNIVAIGWRAGYLNTIGQSWTAVGQSAGGANSVGSSWTALGNGAGQANISGSEWTALGTAAGNVNVTGSNWTAVGRSAARLYADGTDATSFSNGVYLGHSTRVGSASAANEIVIGYQAIGQGSNRTVIGNSSTTTTWLGGNLLVGTTTGSGYRAEISGSSTSGSLNVNNTLYVSGSSVGIGTRTPNNRFEVLQNSGSGFVMRIAHSNDSNNFGAGFVLQNSNTGEAPTGSRGFLFNFTQIQTGQTVNRAFLWNYENGPITMGVNNDEALRIFASRNVLIQNAGTFTDAGFRLDVNGTARIQGNLTTNLTSGSVPFIGASGLVTQDNSNLFWDNANGRLGIGTNTPTNTLDVNGNTNIQGILTVPTGNTLGINYAGTKIVEQANASTFTQILIQPNSGNKAGVLQFAPSGTATSSVLEFYHSTTITNANRFIFKNNNATLQIGSDGASLPITFISNNGQTVRIFGNGNFLIGSSTTDAGFRLDVNGTARIQGNLTTNLTSGSVPFIGASGLMTQDNSNLFWDNTNKRLGIGTTTPTNNITIGAVSSTLSPTNALFSAGLNNASATLQLVTSTDTQNQRSSFSGVRSRGTMAAPSAVQTGDWITTFLSGGWSGTSVEYSAAVLFQIDGAVSSGTVPQSIDFLTGTSSSNRSTKLRVGSNGNVIIQNGGTFTDNGFRLDVSGSGRFTNNLTVTGSLSVTGSVISSGSLTMRDLFTLATRDPLPTSNVPSASLMASGSGADLKPYFWNGASWTALF